jgi:hypothetical protein
MADGDRYRQLACVGLFATCLSYAADCLTDGHLPGAWLMTQIPTTARSSDPHGLLRELLAAGFLEPAPGGYQIVDYLEHNPSKDRIKGTEKARQMAGKRGGTAKANGLASASHVASADIASGQTKPESESKERPNGLSESEPDPEHLRLSQLLADLIVENGSKAPTSRQVVAWADHVRLTVEQDGRTPEQIEAAIRWCQRDQWWRARVMSAAKLRQHFDAMRLDAQRKRGGGKADAKDDNVRGLLERAKELEAQGL